MQRLPFRNAVFDACIGVATFAYPPDKSRVLNQVRAVLKPGGRFILVDMNWSSPIFLLSRLVYGEARDKNHQPWVMKESKLSYAQELLLG